MESPAPATKNVSLPATTRAPPVSFHPAPPLSRPPSGRHVADRVEPALEGLLGLAACAGRGRVAERSRRAQAPPERTTQRERERRAARASYDRNSSPGRVISVFREAARRYPSEGGAGPDPPFEGLRGVSSPRYPVRCPLRRRLRPSSTRRPASLSRTPARGRPSGLPGGTFARPSWGARVPGGRRALGTADAVGPCGLAGGLRAARPRLRARGAGGVRGRARLRGADPDRLRADALPPPGGGRAALRRLGFVLCAAVDVVRGRCTASVRSSRSSAPGTPSGPPWCSASPASRPRPGRVLPFSARPCWPSSLSTSPARRPARATPSVFTRGSSSAHGTRLPRGCRPCAGRISLRRRRVRPAVRASPRPAARRAPRLLRAERTRRIDHALELGRAYRGTALLLGDVIEADDAYTGTHSRDVVALVVATAAELGLDA